MVLRFHLDFPWMFVTCCNMFNRFQRLKFTEFSHEFTTFPGSRELQAVQREARDLRRFVDLLQTHWRSPQFPLHSAAGWSRVARWPWKWWGKEQQRIWMMDMIFYDMISSYHVMSYHMMQFDASWCNISGLESAFHPQRALSSKTWTERWLVHSCAVLMSIVNKGFCRFNRPVLPVDVWIRLMHLRWFSCKQSQASTAGLQAYILYSWYRKSMEK